MTLKEAAKFLQINHITLRRKIHEGLIKATKINQFNGVRGHWGWSISKEQLEDYLKLYDK